MHPILLGTLFAYPFHSKLRETFGMVPAAWLLSQDRNTLRKAVQSVHHLFFPTSEEFISFLAERPDIPAIAQRIRTHPFEPWYLEDWQPTSPGFSQFLSLAIDYGKIPVGVYGTIHHRISPSCPPLVTSNKAPAESAQSSRFLYFPLDGQQSAITPPTRADFNRLLADRHFGKKAERLATTIERELAPKTWLTLRRRIQLSIAFSFFTTADQILNEQPEDSDALLEAITAPRAFDPPENLCV